jgi:hypothetical protein
MSIAAGGPPTLRSSEALSLPLILTTDQLPEAFMKRLLFVALAFVVTALPAAAQVKVGDEVRITAVALPRESAVAAGGSYRDSKLRGKIAALADGSVVLELKGATRVDVPFASIQKLDVRRGLSRGYGALYGGLLGGVAGALGCAVSDCSDEGIMGGSDAVILLGGAGAVLGAGIGALVVGSGWDNVPLDKVRVSVAPLPGGGVGAAVSLGF